MTELTILMTGLGMGESPRWHDGRVWFSDMGTQHVTATDLLGNHEIVAKIPGMPMGLGWHPDGTMLIVSSADGQLLRLGSPSPFADLSALSAYPWSDMAMDSRGNAYIGNIGFDFGSGDFPTSPTGILAVVAPSGEARQVAADLAFPNGIAITPDNSTLIVAESYANCLTAFDISPDGSLSSRRVWAGLGDGVPDGICLDVEGAVWYADVPNQRCVRVREGGEVLQTIDVDRGCFACVLGGDDLRTLFIVAAQWLGPESMASPALTGQLLSTPVSVAGTGSP